MKLIVDTDIGDDIDDAFALSFLRKSEEAELLGITTVYKNVAQRAKIAKKLMGENVPVYAGENKPLAKEVRLLFGETIKQDGLIDIDHYSFAAQNEIYDGDDAIEFILSTLKKYPNEVTLLAIGPLTNLAKALERDADAFRKAKRLVIMGGRFQNRISEWNIETDPEAAKEVFASGVETLLVPFDVTNLCNMTQADVAAVRRLSGESEKYLATMMNRWIEHYDPNWDGKDKFPVLHDVLAAMLLIDESVCTYRISSFDFCTETQYSECTYFTDTGKYRAKIAVSLNKDKFWTVFHQIMGMK